MFVDISAFLLVTIHYVYQWHWKEFRFVVLPCLMHKTSLAHTVLWRKYMQVCVENFAQAVAMMAACWKAVLLRGGWLGRMKAQSF